MKHMLMIALIAVAVSACKNEVIGEPMAPEAIVAVRSTCIEHGLRFRYSEWTTGGVARVWCVP